jgi:hypothetical protein
MKLHAWRSEQMSLRYGIVDNTDKTAVLEQEEQFIQEQLRKQAGQASRGRPN